MTSPLDKKTDSRLTKKQREVLSCLIAAPNQKTAAEWLGITDRQVRRHIERIQRRFDVETANQAIVMAALTGQVDPGALPSGSFFLNSAQRKHAKVDD